VTDPEGLGKVLRDIGHGRADGLIAAAGINIVKVALEYKAEEINRLLEVSVKGIFLTAQAVAKEMIRYWNGGSILLVGR